MPDNTTPPADGQQGTGTPIVGAPAAAEPPKPGKTFTQEELDAILEARLKRAVPSDYEDLKKLAERVKAQEDQEKTDLQKALEAQALAEKKAGEALSKANATLRRAAIIAEASAQNAADTDVVIALLAGSDDITVTDDGEVKGVKAAVAKLLKEKPFLAKATAGATGGEFGGVNPATLDEKIREAESKGDWQTARRLKSAKMVG